jgi:hypothetical protein
MNDDETLKNKILHLRKLKYTYNQIRDELKCSKGTISYHCRREGVSNYNTYRKLDDSLIDEIISLYKEISSIRMVAKILNVSKFSVSKYLNEHNFIIKLSSEQLKINNKENVITWRKNVKLKLVQYKGGECSNCGYNKSVRALEFHHLDPNKKDFNISGSSRSFEMLKKEVDKCILVCSNCHKEIHEEIENKNKIIKILN